MKPVKLSPKQLENIQALEKFTKRCKIKRLRRDLNNILFHFAGLGDDSPIPIDKKIFPEYAELNNLLENISG